VEEVVGDVLHDADDLGAGELADERVRIGEPRVRVDVLERDRRPGTIVMPQRKPGENATSASNRLSRASRITSSNVPLKVERRYSRLSDTARRSARRASHGARISRMSRAIAGSSGT
jgi:hypothetical protein